MRPTTPRCVRQRRRLGAASPPCTRMWQCGLSLIHISNINMIAIVAGALLYWFRVVLPAPLQNTMSTVGDMMGPLGMLLAGMAIAEKPLREVFCTRRNYLDVYKRQTGPAPRAPAGTAPAARYAAALPHPCARWTCCTQTPPLPHAPWRGWPQCTPPAVPPAAPDRPSLPAPPLP